MNVFECICHPFARSQTRTEVNDECENEVINSGFSMTSPIVFLMCRHHFLFELAPLGFATNTCSMVCADRLSAVSVAAGSKSL